ncbi:hypothetical protein RHS04_01369 [Rhizoctonia solani]|uniref:Transmembrane protein n=1 Tax=Rhizoctonia solani TaxID=456999 RepID=A0A8H7HEY0_9AGAM|nr:hypothetical protein RHS04_01369 [Rhizoctonia solani]
MSEDETHLLGHHQTRSSLQLGVHEGTRSNVVAHIRPTKQVNFDILHEVHAFDLEDNLDDSFLDPGVGCGVAHHAFNSYLDGRLTTSFDQAWAIRIGTALAMGLKTALLASMGMAFTQQVWKSVRGSTFSVKALDSLFGAFGGDPRSLFQADLYRSARLALLLAIVAWLLPIATVFTPATLRIKPVDRSSSSICLVPTLDLGNVTDRGLIRYPSPGGRYRGPSPSLRRLVFQSLLSGSFTRSIHYPGSTANINITYPLSLVAPALECSEQNSTAQVDPNPQRDTFWRGTRYDVRDGNSGQNVPILQILYTSSPRTRPPTTLNCVPYISNYGITVYSNATKQVVSLSNLTMISPASQPGGSMSLVNDNPLLTGAAALIDATFDVFTGNLSQDQNGNLLSPSSNAALASFINPSEQAPFIFVNISDNVERLMQNVVISIISLELFQTETTCFAVDRVNVYLYDQSVLVNAYVIVICVAIVTLGVGIYALRDNGHSSDTSFSGFVLATRNPTLDQACEGGRKQLLTLRIKFGILRSDGRPAFGRPSEFH